MSQCRPIGGNTAFDSYINFTDMGNGDVIGSNFDDPGVALLDEELRVLYDELGAYFGGVQ